MKIEIKKETNHLIKVDLSLNSYLFDIYLICTSQTFCGRNWHLLMPTWELNCRVGEDDIYNQAKLEEKLPEDYFLREGYTKIIAKTITNVLKKHDKEINEAILKRNGIIKS